MESPTYKYAITDVAPFRMQETGKDMLDVVFDILVETPQEDGTIRESVAEQGRRLGFETTITEEEIKEELTRYVETYAGEQAQKITQKGQDEQDEHVAQLRAKLVPKKEKREEEEE